MDNFSNKRISSSQLDNYKERESKLIKQAEESKKENKKKLSTLSKVLISLAVICFLSACIVLIIVLVIFGACTLFKLEKFFKI